PCTPSTLRPMARTAASSSSWRLPVMKTYAPSATKRSAVASPRPLLPPVMTAIFPSSFPMEFSFEGVLYRSVWNTWVAMLTQAQDCIDRYGTRENGRSPAVVRCRRGAGSRATRLLAQGVRRNLAGRPYAGDAHQSPEHLRRLREQGGLVPQGRRSVRRRPRGLHTRGP